jgi:hypothetical protein
MRPSAAVMAACRQTWRNSAVFTYDTIGREHKNDCVRVASRREHRCDGNRGTRISRHRLKDDVRLDPTFP